MHTVSDPTSEEEVSRLRRRIDRQEFALREALHLLNDLAVTPEVQRAVYPVRLLIEGALR